MKCRLDIVTFWLCSFKTYYMVACILLHIFRCIQIIYTIFEKHLKCLIDNFETFGEVAELVQNKYQTTGNQRWSICSS